MQQPKMTSKSRITHKTDSNGRRGTSEISLTHAAFASLLDTIFYPNPDDSGEPKNPFGPFGPAGPVTQRWMWAALNPQPLPPGSPSIRNRFHPAQTRTERRSLHAW